MKKILFIIVIIGVLHSLIIAQNQLQSITSSVRQSPTSNLVTQDSLFNFYNANNTSQATQINKIWTNSELILEPNYNLSPVLRTTEDSSVRMKNGGSFTAPLKLVWATANWYNVNHTQIVKQNVYGYWNGTLGSFHTSYFYYTPTIDSNIFYSGASPATALTLSLRRFFYKSITGIFDSIIDKYYDASNVNTQTIKWNFKYNTYGNLIEWKYQNPAYSISNKLYKLFYTGSSSLVDSVQYYNGGSLYYQSTYTYLYGSNNEWSTIAYKPAYNSSNYPNGIASYKNSNWGTQVYCDSIDNFYYYPANQLNTYKSINNFTSTGFIESENNIYQAPATGTSSKTKYNYNFTNVATTLIKINKYNFVIYPNPTNGILNISLMTERSRSNEAATLVITDVLGKTILSKTITEKTTQLNVSDFTKGIYFVTIKSDNKTSAQKLIIN